MLLPGGRDGELRGGRIFGRMSSMKEVGGDFFNYFSLDDDRFFFVVADVAGHGIPAALFMMSAEAALSCLVRAEPDLERVFRMLNARLCDRNSEGYFVTAFAGIFDSSDGRLRYLNAGHPVPFVKTGGSGFRALPYDVNLVLGAFEVEEYRAYDFFMQKGNVLCVYTDGVTEAMNADSEQYSAERLVKALDSAGSDDPKALADHIFADVAKFTDGAEQSDDITALCVRFGEKP
jgi:sigma-B regulation protein RsbU (phosphoserine phosphatase)